MCHQGRTARLRGRAHCVAAACLALLCAGLLPGAAWAAEDAATQEAPERQSYRIDARSADSWAHYYTLIGLGNVDRGPHLEVDREALTAHCATLEDLTEHAWIPLGYSIQLGYKLCYRIGPFTWAEARVMCARLRMRVKELTDRAIVCARQRNLPRTGAFDPFL